MASEIDLARKLLKRASDDEAAAKAMLPVESVTDVIVGQHAQQGVEKAIKAVLAARGVDFPFIHDIKGLAKLCKEAGVPLPDELREADQLTPYAGGLRYDEDSEGLVDRKTALQWVSTAVAWARAVIEEAEAQAGVEADESQPPERAR